MRRTVYTLCSCVLLTGAVGLFSQETQTLPRQLDLATAKRLALQGNPGVAALLERVGAAEALISQARSALRPRVDADASASWLRDVPLSRGGGDDTPFFRVGATADWLVFDGFATRFRVEAAKAGVQTSLAEWHDGRRLLAQGVADAFLTSLLADEAGQITSRSASFNRELLEEAEKRFRAGSGPRVDVLNFSVRLREAENSLLGTQRAARAARQVLAALMGLQDTVLPSNTELVPPTDDLSARFPDAQAAIEAAFSQRPDLQAYDHSMSRLKATLDATWSGKRPKIMLQGAYALERADNLDFNGDRDASSSVTARLSWNLFDGGLRTATVAEIKAQCRALDEARDQLRLHIARDVRSALDYAETATKQAANQKDITGMFQDIRDIVHKEYLSGSASLTRLNEAQTDLVTAEGQLARTRILSQQALEGLAAAMGNNLPVEDNATASPQP